MSIRRIVSIYALAIGLALGAGLAAISARADEPPDTGTAARLAQPDSIIFCINESKAALDMVRYIQKNGGTLEELVKHIKVGDGSSAPIDQIMERKFATALVTDVFNAYSWIKAHGYPEDELPAWTAQMILESCGYEYGKNAVKK